MIDKIKESIIFKIIKKDSRLGSAIDKIVTKEVITYIIFGVLTTAVNWAVYTLFVKFLGIGVTFSNAVAWVAGVLFAFITNKLFVFESRSFKPIILARELLSFVAARAVTGVMEIFGVPLLIKIGLSRQLFGVEGAVAKALVSVIVIILNYIFSKLVVFKREPKKSECEEGQNEISERSSKEELK